MSWTPGHWVWTPSGQPARPIRHFPWGLHIGRLHVTWYDAWRGGCTGEGLITWEKER